MEEYILKEELQKAVPQLTDEILNLLYRYIVSRYCSMTWKDAKQLMDDDMFDAFCKRLLLEYNIRHKND